MACYQILTHSVASVAKSPEESCEKAAVGEGRGRAGASEHGASGPVPPPKPAAGACEERPARWTQPGPPHTSSTAVQSESACHSAGDQER